MNLSHFWIPRYLGETDPHHNRVNTQFELLIVFYTPSEESFSKCQMLKIKNSQTSKIIRSLPFFSSLKSICCDTWWIFHCLQIFLDFHLPSPTVVFKGAFGFWMSWSEKGTSWYFYDLRLLIISSVLSVYVSAC